MLALALSAFFDLATTPPILAQKLALRPASALVFGCGAGALSLEPVSLLYLARPLAVKPAPLLTGSFSPRPTDKETDFAILLAVNQSKVNDNCFGI
jgi:hypothetical protein